MPKIQPSPSTPLGDSPATSTSTEPRPLPLRFRLWVLALPLLVLTCFLSVYADMVSRVVQFGVLQFAPPALVMLFFVALGNHALRHLTRREWLNRAEMLTLYAMLLTGVLVSTRGIVEKLIPPLAYLPYFSTRENRLAESVSQYLPAWAVPFVPSASAGNASPAIAGYWEGNGGAVPWNVWLGPLCAWFGLLACVVLVFLCLATLLRRQWMDNEQLRFPLTTLPLALITGESENTPFFSNRAMWGGAALSFGVFALNGLNANISDVPSLVTDFPLWPFFSERPFNAMSYTPLYISLAAVGFAFFLPLDLLFSFWFFFVLTRVQDVAAVSFGALPTDIGTHDARIFTGFQAAGAYLVLLAAYCRIGWPYFKAAFSTALGHKTLDDSGELMSYRAAFVGLALGFAGIVLWLSLAGMSPLVALAQMGIYLFVLAIIMSRAVSEGGLLMTETSFLPSHLINLVAPIPSLGAQNVALLGLTNVTFARDMRGLLLTAFLDAQKLGKEIGLAPRRLLGPLVVAVAVGTLCATLFFLHFNYEKGGLALYAYSNQNNPAGMFRLAAAQNAGHPPPNDATAWGGLGVGIVVTLLLVYARGAFSWFPFHPLGYALAPTWAMNCFWFPFLVAWMIKGLIMRFGGIESYRKLAPFMLGLILGEFSAAVFWSLGNIARGWNVPAFPWP